MHVHMDTRSAAAGIDWRIAIIQHYRDLDAVKKTILNYTTAIYNIYKGFESLTTGSGMTSIIANWNMNA